MTSKDNLLKMWQELIRFWNDEAARTFENQHLNKIVECMEELACEYEKFKHCTDDHQ